MNLQGPPPPPRSLPHGLRPAQLTEDPILQSSPYPVRLEIAPTRKMSSRCSRTADTLFSSASSSATLSSTRPCVRDFHSLHPPLVAGVPGSVLTLGPPQPSSSTRSPAEAASSPSSSRVRPSSSSARSCRRLCALVTGFASAQPAPASSRSSCVLPSLSTFHSRECKRQGAISSSTGRATSQQRRRQGARRAFS